MTARLELMALLGKECLRRQLLLDEYKQLLNIMAGVIAGEIHRSRVEVDLEAGTWRMLDEDEPNIIPLQEPLHVRTVRFPRHCPG